MTKQITQENEPVVEAQLSDTGACVSVSVTCSVNYYRILESPSGNSMYNKWENEKFISIKMQRDGQALNPVKTAREIIKDIKEIIK